MSSSSLEEVRITVGMSLVRGSERRRSSTSSPESFGSLRSSRITAGIRERSRPACAPSPKRKSSASAPSRATTISLAIFAWRSARVVSSSSSGLSSTSRIILSDIDLPFLQQSAERPGRERLGEEIALAFVAAVLAQEAKLLGGLDALGEHAQAERVAHGNDRLRERRVAAALAGLRHERPVDLQAVDRQAREIREARVPGAEVVHRDVHPELLQILQHAQRALAIVDQRALGELELERARIEVVQAEGGGHRLDEAVAAELARRDVDRDAHRTSGRMPLRGALHRLHQGPVAELLDQLRLLGDRDEQRRRDEAALGMLPAHERLEADDGSGGEIDLRLVMQLDLLLADGRAQRILQLDALQRLPRHVRGVELEGVAAGVLDPVGGGVGVAQQAVEVLAVARIHARAHAERHVGLATL